MIEISDNEEDMDEMIAVESGHKMDESNTLSQ